MSYKKKLIETALPITAINIECVRENQYDKDTYQHSIDIGQEGLLHQQEQ